VAGTAVAATGLAAFVTVSGPSISSGSSHREAPSLATDPRADNTDVYAFVSPDDATKVTLVANWLPFEEPNGGPNFYPWANDVAYDLEVDNDGDASPDIVYRWIFKSTYRSTATFLYTTGVVTTLDDPDLNFQQTYDLSVSKAGGAFTAMATNQPVAPSNVGPASMPNYQALRDAAVVNVATGTKSFAGQADDSFFLDLRVFDLLYGGDLSQVGNDTLNGYNVNTIALQVPANDLALNGSAANNPVIGVISTTSRRSVRTLSATGGATESGAFAQVSRLGQPLVNEVVVPVKLKDAFNNSRPTGDADFLPLVTDPEVPKLIEAIYKVPNPNKLATAAGRPDLVEIFLTGVSKDGKAPPALEADINAHSLNKDKPSDVAPSEQLRLNMSVPPTVEPNSLGVIAGDLAGFPNGRRLADDVVDIELKVLEGVLFGADTSVFTDKVNSNDLVFGRSFPYVALPHNSSVNASQFTSFERLGGNNRYETAVVIAKKAFASSDTVVLANGDNEAYADALTASYIAGDRNTPVLLTMRDSTPSSTVQALKDLAVKILVLIGGNTRISAAQEAELAKTHTIKRISGNDRYDTARAVAVEPGAANVHQATAILANGVAWPDALVSAPVSFSEQFPILLTQKDSLSTQAKSAINALSIKRVFVAGGTAVVSDAVVKSLTDSGITVIRLGGANRTETAVAMSRFAANELGFNRTRVNLARGDVPADSLTGGPLAGLGRSTVLLTNNSTDLSAATTAYLAEESISLEGGYVFGGSAAISNGTVNAANDAANSND